MHVLVYVDPAPRGEWALAVAAQLASRWASSLHLLATEEDASVEPTLLERARERLAAARPVTVSTRPGPAESAVAQEALQGRYDLLVVPPAGRGAVARMLKGSRVATVVRRVLAPVLVARRPPPRIERVLAAISGRASTEAVVDMALAWQREAGAAVDFLHVRPEVALPTSAPGSAGEREAPGSSDLETARSALRSRGLPGGPAVREGLVVDEVLDLYEAGAYQLLVVGARSEGPAFGREDVTERLLLRCPGSTLVVGRVRDVSGG
jgi:nucleotide-binding universal stress UspA family protein